MKALYLMAFAWLTVSSANAQTAVETIELGLTGENLFGIRHMTEMKVLGDTLFIVYESDGGHGQRFLRRATIDKTNNVLVFGPEIGKYDNGYYQSYLPYPFFGDDGRMHVISQDDGEIYEVEAGNALYRTKRYLIGVDCKLPFAISQYVQDVSMMGSGRYVFIGREPRGGRQYAMTANLDSACVDTVCHISVSEDLPSWIPNVGELAYSSKYNRLAFAYKMHPVVEIRGLDGTPVGTVKVGECTFNPETLDEADSEDLNPCHFMDVSNTQDYIYALYWGYGHADAAYLYPMMYKIDWTGNIVDRTVGIDIPLYRIAVCDDDTFIGWTGDGFAMIRKRAVP